MNSEIQDQVVEMLEAIPGVNVQGNRVTVNPRATGRELRLRANKNGKGYVTSYTLSIGCAEAVQAGFVDDEKNPLPLEKIVDADGHSITFRVKQSRQ